MKNKLATKVGEFSSKVSLLLPRKCPPTDKRIGLHAALEGFVGLETHQQNTATTASGFPVNGGTTTFSDTLSIHLLPITVRLNRQGSILTLSWIGGTGPYRVQKATNLSWPTGTTISTNAQSPVTLEADDPIGFYRVVEP